jgi:hypothetical protein
MGALGCSDGPEPSSVVCAHAPMVKLLAIANVKIAIPDRNLFFITSSPLLTLQTLMNEEYLAKGEATALPKRARISDL